MDIKQLHQQAMRNVAESFGHQVEHMRPDSDFVAREFMRLALNAATAAQPQPIEVTDAMVAAYLQANDAYWKRTDELPTPPNKWRTGTPSEATRESLKAALAATTAAQPAGPEDMAVYAAIAQNYAATAAQPDELRRAVRRMADVLESGEWAEHVSADPDAAELEAAITDLHSEHSAMHDALMGAGWTLTDGEWIAPAAATAAQPQREVVGWVRQDQEGPGSLDPLYLAGPALPNGYTAAYMPVCAALDDDADELAAATAAQPDPLRAAAQKALEALTTQYPGGWANDVQKCVWDGVRREAAEALEASLAPAAGATGEAGNA